MFEKLDNMLVRYEELNHMLSDPKIIGEQELYKSYIKEHAKLSDTVTLYKNYLNTVKELYEIEKMHNTSDNDKEFEDLLKTEAASLKTKIEELKENLVDMLKPKDPNDDKNVIVEIRGGAGGEEAALFATSLFRMYSMYAEKNNWKIDITDANYTDLGGVKEIVFIVEGEGAFSRLKYESGVHRVQRVPDTESSGRIHTSTVTVAVLPEIDDVEVTINPSDLQIDTYRSGGAGGQHINKTESAIRITHIPTGIVVTCQDERSQYKNKDKAMRVLRSRLYDIAEDMQNANTAQTRKNQVGTGDRSERIRTYNFPQGRMTDHRIGLTLYKLDDIINGDLDELLDALSTSAKTSEDNTSEKSDN